MMRRSIGTQSPVQTVDGLGEGILALKAEFDRRAAGDAARGPLLPRAQLPAVLRALQVRCGALCCCCAALLLCFAPRNPQPP